MQKSSNSKNFTFISTVIKRLAAESLRLKIKMAQNPTSWIQMVKSQTSKKLSLKNLVVEILLKKSVGKKCVDKYTTQKHMQQKVKGQKKKSRKKI